MIMNKKMINKMKKIFFLCTMCIIVLSTHAQRCAVMEFKARVGISQEGVDGISSIFLTYFQPAGYTMVERTQIDKVIEEQGFQRSKMTQAQMVRVGEILNVSKIVVGDINVVNGQYNVDARVINVESGTISAVEGATFATSTYRTNMQSLAQKLAAQIAIRPGDIVQAPSKPKSMPKSRNTVETLYGYLKIFPNELGTFESVPSTVIAQINKQVQHGYNNWRIPTTEELSLMEANNYLGDGEYMTIGNGRGIVLLVTDGKDYATLQAEEQEREAAALKAEQERKAAEQRAAQEKQAAEERRAAQLKVAGLVDLGLPSGTLWKEKNELGSSPYYTYRAAALQFGNRLPTKEQFEELKSKCRWTWNGAGYKIIGPNGNFIELPASGFRDDEDNCVKSVGGAGNYWSSQPYGSEAAYFLEFTPVQVKIRGYGRYAGFSVRLVENP